MCGIVGIIDLKGREVRQESVKIMTDAISHRGPDGEGQWVFENIGIGHRRLAIIDLSEAASQPMISSDGNYALTYNGEIYNYKEIRKELENLGYIFSTQSDTEVLLASLIVWKEKALLKFNGMFAFAFFDILRNEVMIARDRYGIKPLYYSLQDSYFTFGSEQKAIKARLNFRSALDKDAFLEYMAFQNIFSNKTLEADIKLLEAGHYMLINTKSNSIKNPIQYWDYEFTEPERIKFENDYAEELDFYFRQAVKRTLISDVEVGAYLSGGIDSGSIVAIASQEKPNLKTFTVGFDLSTASGIELGFDERSQAKLVANLFKTQHFQIEIKSGDIERSMSRLVHHIEEPRMGQSYPNMYAAHLARKSVKVVLSGTGGDELFGGYPWRYFQVNEAASYNDYLENYYNYWQRLFDTETLNKLVAPIASGVSKTWTRDVFTKIFKKNSNTPTKPEDFLNQSLYFEAKTFLHGLFVVEDKLSMSYGLETRVPFMDNDLVDFAMKLPSRLKVKNLPKIDTLTGNLTGNKKSTNFHKTNDGKYILRKTMNKYLPEEITQQVKKGFSSPDASWFSGESINYVRNTLLNINDPLYKLLDYEVTSSILESHFSGKANRRLAIWSLLNLQELIRQNG